MPQIVSYDIEAKAVHFFMTIKDDFLTNYVELVFRIAEIQQSRRSRNLNNDKVLLLLLAINNWDQGTINFESKFFYEYLYSLKRLSGWDNNKFVLAGKKTVCRRNWKVSTIFSWDNNNCTIYNH